MIITIISQTLVLLFSIVASYDQSINDCYEVAALFENTCVQSPYGSADWTSAFQSSTVTCSNMIATCPDTSSSSPPNCEWERKLCVSCSTNSTDGYVYIRIQTNNLPNHCYGYQDGVYMKEQKLDFSVRFNPQITSGVTETSFSNQATVDEAVCYSNKSYDSNVPSTSGFFLNTCTDCMTSSDSLVGVAKNGVFVYSSASDTNADPYYPKTWSGSSSLSSETVDACIANLDSNGAYHYRMLPPCLVDTSLPGNIGCSDIEECYSDLKGYALSSYTSYAQTSAVLGIAKDGHLIMGPYDENGKQYDCKTADQCGGFETDDGSYAYLYQNTFGYSLSCFGPAMDYTYKPSCTSNGCTPTVDSFGSMSQNAIWIMMFGFIIVNMIL